MTCEQGCFSKRSNILFSLANSSEIGITSVLQRDAVVDLVYPSNCSAGEKMEGGDFPRETDCVPCHASPARPPHELTQQTERFSARGLENRRKGDGPGSFDRQG